MNAYKCDRCNNYFDKKKFRVIKIYIHEGLADICEDCYQSLLKWMGVNESGCKIQETKE